MPLVIRLPQGRAPGRRIDAQLELTDVMPTVLDLADAIPPATMRGRSLLPALEGEGSVMPHVWAFSVAGPGMRIASVRGPRERLSWMGPSLRSDEAVAMLQTARLDSGSNEVLVASLDGTPHHVSEESLHVARDAMIARLRAARRVRYLPGAPLSPGQTETLRAHGYWTTP